MSGVPVLGLDIGGTKLAAGVLAADGRVHGFLFVPTQPERGVDDVIGRLFALGRRSVGLAQVGEVGAVGIACGGPLDGHAGVLRAPLHLPGWLDVPIVALARQAFGRPAVLANDATAAAWGEYRLGCGRGSASMIYLTISTGVGGGAVIDGRLLGGAAGNGGEFGHITVRPGGRQCSCPRRGCLEAYASGTSIAARAAEALRSGEPSVLSRLEHVSAADVALAARSGDGLARRVWDETVELLGDAVTSLVNVLEPDLVVLGGGVTRSGDQLIGRLRGIVARDAMGPAGAVARVEMAGLGDMVGVAGAAALASDQLPLAAAVAEGLRVDV